MELFIDAKLTWNLDALYTDLSSIKTLELTDWEKTCLRGLLCGVHPEAIAAKMFWTASALKTELSRRVYPHISILVDEKVIAWHKVPTLLEKAGYKYPEIRILNQELFYLEFSASPSSNSKLIRASAIVELLIKNSSCQPNQAKELPNAELKSTVEGDRHYQQGNFIEAIDSYRQVLTIDPLNVSILTKLARCYEHLGFYKDSLFICDFVLDRIERSDRKSHLQKTHNKSIIYYFIAGLFHKLAVNKYCDDYVQIAFEIYQKYLYLRPQNIMALWNIVDLFISVVRHGAIAPELKSDYMDRAKKALSDFKGNARQLDFNFKPYREPILEKAENTFQDLDCWWQEQLHELKSW
ncbi:MAG: tetratricopeptide repeat protein [Cyanosarcina radialis HA8281-LM2]|jgi:tetratricopeptide (TPR) repeat protein|nr:tetratricopeptide repeat protein [Cyanosarcina radialis HA8281-LM2]